MENHETRSTEALNGVPDHQLSALLDTILPASEDGAMPSAREMDFAAYLRDQAADFAAELKRISDQFDDGFADLPLAERVTRMRAFAESDAATFNGFVFRVYDCYYQDDRVRRLIGARPGPPFPGGNVIISGDLSSLEAVKARGKGYRT
jgi:hypothetical protein